MNYQIADPDPSKLMERWQLSELCARLIAASLLSEEQIRELLDADSTIRVSKAPCIDQVCQALMEAKRKKQKVFVAGDYDADGVCSTAIMKDTLDRLGIENGYYIPNRFREGYGLSAATVRAASEKGYQLIVTVDNGVKCHEAIACAHDLGMKIIVTDHHRMEEEVPADLLVHPDLMEEICQDLCGAGVALQISRTLLGDVPKHTALAMIATLGDVMPLWRQNRQILKQGMTALSQNALLPASVLLRDSDTVHEDAVRFQIVPKLNSVGRLSDRANVNTLVQYLLCENPRMIESYRVQLNRLNETRRAISAGMVTKAEQMMREEPVSILYDPQFHEGICGLAAGRLADTYQRPFIILAKHADMLKGSARSVPGFDLYEFLSTMEELTEFGGHAQAVGLSLPASRLEQFRASVAEKLSEVSLKPETEKKKAVRIPARDLCVSQIMELEGLRPFPKELITCCAVEEPEVVSIQNYSRVTRVRMQSPSGFYDGICFSWQGIEWTKRPHWIFGQPEINRFRDRISVQLAVEAIE